MEEKLEFKFDGVTMKCLNPEAIPIFKKNLAKLIVKLMEKQREKV
jgi:hypothetical protein